MKSPVTGLLSLSLLGSVLGEDTGCRKPNLRNGYVEIVHQTSEESFVYNYKCEYNLSTLADSDLM